MDTTVFDLMFPDVSPTEEHLPFCDKILDALRAKGTSYEAQAWEEVAKILEEYPEFKKWQEHFEKVSSKMKAKQENKNG